MPLINLSANWILWRMLLGIMLRLCNFLFSLQLYFFPAAPPKMNLPHNTTSLSLKSNFFDPPLRPFTKFFSPPPILEDGALAMKLPNQLAPKQITNHLIITAWKVFRYGVFSVPYFPAFGLHSVFSSNVGKYGPEKIRIWTHFTKWITAWLQNSTKPFIKRPISQTNFRKQEGIRKISSWMEAEK